MASFDDRREDFRLPPHPVYVPVTLIRDGQLLADELAELGKTEQWLAAKLQKTRNCLAKRRVDRRVARRRWAVCSDVSARRAATVNAAADGVGMRGRKNPGMDSFFILEKTLAFLLFYVYY
ncbi:hypothetical protein GA8_14040 [Geobacillus sp. A8]|uniref:YetF domain-containing protein n=1 Tax=Geobacillus sp. A8 TaxID=1095383 RepID=UPI00038A13BA|nr:YetF domain-containing protein [Geobacillus sp. A8]EQB94958.1 hypothetical protein GA8_14040 [Geobacillus sp. A8]